MAKTQTIKIEDVEFEMTKWGIVHACRMTKKCTPLIQVFIDAKNGKDFNITDVIDTVLEGDDGLALFATECLKGTRIVHGNLKTEVTFEQLDEIFEEYHIFLMLVKEVLVFNLSDFFTKGLDGIIK